MCFLSCLYYRALMTEMDCNSLWKCALLLQLTVIMYLLYFFLKKKEDARGRSKCQIKAILWRTLAANLSSP